MYIFCLALILSASVCAFAQPARDQATGADIAAVAELRAKGSDALLNLDYENARRSFQEIARRFPDDPIGPQMLAWTLWLETLNQARLRHATTYTSQSFEANSEDKPEPRVSQEFRNLIRQATQLANAHLRSNPHDPQTLYVLGAIETVRAGYELTIEGRSLASLRDAASGVEKDREVIKLDPNFHDAELSIGLFDYVVGNLPLTARLVANLAGAHGSKKRGLQTLERVAQDGHFERDNARLLLMVLYKHEKRFTESLALSRILQDRYPRNYLFNLESADSLASQAVVERQAGRAGAANDLEKDALAVFDSLIRERSGSNANGPVLSVIHFRYGEALLSLDQPERAAHELLTVTTINGADSALITAAHLRAAQALDLAGKRDEALAEYRIVATRPNTDNSLSQARHGLKESYKKTK